MGRMFQRREAGKFELKPQYWDPEKEERNNRERRINDKLGIENEEGEHKSYGENHLRGKFTGRFAEHAANRRASSGRRTLRLFGILIAIFIIVFYLLARHSNEVMRYFGIQ